MDTVEVVRCRDCKYLMFSDFYGECGKGHMGVVGPDDFCSRGERRSVTGITAQLGREDVKGGGSHD